MIKCPRCKYEFKNPISIEGGKRSKRRLTSEQAREMVKTREEKRKTGEKIEKGKR